MIRTQCSAYCQCAYCAGKTRKDGKGDTNVLPITQRDADAAQMTKDELYAKSLQNSIRTAALLSSTKNASKFIPDEQLLSSAKRREAKEASVASQMVPLRRRDRLEELLLLEHKSRLREEARLRAERIAAGLPVDDETPVPSTPAESVPPTPASAVSSEGSRQKRLSDASRCSADRDLQAALSGIKAIVDEEEPSGPRQPLTRGQITKLRQIVRSQEQKSRTQFESCDYHPHMCNHCLATNVQARHLAPHIEESVAFETTGKIINPEEGLKFGTDSKRALGGTYTLSAADQQELSLKSGKTQLASYHNHPYGTGVVFPPMQTVNSTQKSASGKSVRFEPTFNNNIGATEPVEDGLQYPGSTYNVYDDRANTLGRGAGAGAGAGSGSGPRVNFADTANSDGSSRNSSAGGQSPQNGAASAAAGAAGSAAAPGAADSSIPKSSSALWMTTNQARDADMERFIQFQKNLNATGKAIYDSTATRKA